MIAVCLHLGGAGYIGTHCIVELLSQNYNVVAIDNFINAVRGENGKRFGSTIIQVQLIPIS